MINSIKKTKEMFVQRMAATVMTCNDIPVNVTVTAEHATLDLGKYLEDQKLVQNVVKVWYNNGSIQSEEGLDWVPFVSAARDRHEQNLELYRDTSGRLCYRTIRHILQGEQLLVWYSPTMALDMSIPIIGIHNIRDAGCYTCLFCGYESGFPNTLKAHIKFHCNKQVMSPAESLPRRTASVKQETLKDNSQHKMYNFKQYKHEPEDEHGLETRSYQVFEPNISKPCIVEPKREHVSSFQCNVTYNLGHWIQPYNMKTSILVKSSADPVESDYRFPSNFQLWHRYRNSNTSRQRFLKNNSFSTVSSFNNPDDESINVFHNSLLELSSRRGHLCLYCGKFYSRKYGLKIHLRTHTGYKPLKCKICLRPFGDPSNLNKHVRLHADGDTPYKCKHCGKILVRRRDLARHVKSRHPEFN